MRAGECYTGLRHCANHLQDYVLAELAKRFSMPGGLTQPGPWPGYGQGAKFRLPGKCGVCRAACYVIPLCQLVTTMPRAGQPSCQGLSIMMQRPMVRHSVGLQ